MSEDGLSISLQVSVKTGFVFLICNCVIALVSGLYHRGIIPYWHGYVFSGMYICYMTMNAQNLLM